MELPNFGSLTWRDSCSKQFLMSNNDREMQPYYRITHITLNARIC